MNTSPDIEGTQGAESSKPTVEISARSLSVATHVAGLLIGALGGFLVGQSVSSGETSASPTPTPTSAPTPTPTPTPSPTADPNQPPAPLPTAPPINFEGIATPAGVTPGGAYPLSTEGPLVEVYEDLRCPACGQFNEIAGPSLETAIANNTAQVQVTLTAFQNSLEVTNAAACVWDVKPESFLDFTKNVYTAANNPTVNLADPAQLTGIAAESGVPVDAVSPCIVSGQFNEFVQQVTAVAAGARQVTFTPAVIIDGQLLPNWGPLPEILNQ